MRSQSRRIWRRSPGPIVTGSIVTGPIVSPACTPPTAAKCGSKITGKIPNTFKRIGPVTFRLITTVFAHLLIGVTFSV